MSAILASINAVNLPRVRTLLEATNVAAFRATLATERIAQVSAIYTSLNYCFRQQLKTFLFCKYWHQYVPALLRDIGDMLYKCMILTYLVLLLNVDLKYLIIKSVSQSVDLYGALKPDSKSLDAFHMKCQRRIHGNILASIRAERRGCRSHWSFLPVGHHLSPTFSHIWSHSKAWRGSACPQGAAQLHQPISWAFTGPFLEVSSWSSTWQMDRPAPKR